MCEFCLKHGEGEKWYLRAKNYSEDLLNDIKRRKFIQNFFKDTESLRKSADDIERLEKLPSFIRGIIKRLTTHRMKKVHFGQVVPIEEIEKIFGFVNSIVRVACICRHVTHKEEKRYCYGVSVSPNGGKFAEIFSGVDNSFISGPDGSGYEVLSKEEAISAFREHEKEGLCHTVWTFGTPFIGGICNCDRTDCLAMRCTVSHELPVMFKAEYLAEINADKCTGCRECMRVCQFGAISYSASAKKSFIDKKWCYGCGVCRSACKRDAIGLKERVAA